MNQKRSALCVFALLLLNISIVVRLFRTQFTPMMWSMEGSYIGLARWLAVNWALPGWFPLWYGGIPVENAYPPLIHSVVAFTSMATGMIIPHAWHAVTAWFYCLGPVAMFGLVLRLTQSHWKAITAAWFYSLVSPSAFLISSSIGRARRVGRLGMYGILALDEGPRIASIAILMAALAAIHAAVEHKLGWRTELAVLLTAAAGFDQLVRRSDSCPGVARTSDRAKNATNTNGLP